MMKPIFTLICLLSSLFLSAQELDFDSLGKTAIIQAAHHNIKALRPTYQLMGNKMPHFIKLYCDIAIASSEGRHERVIECIDSLKQWYPKKLQKNTLLSFAELKAEGLRQLGKYDELKAHCITEIKYFERRRFKPNRLKELYFYLKKAKRLLGSDVRSQLLQNADRNNVVELDSLLSLRHDELDEFARLRGQIVLDHAFHNCEALAKHARTLVEEYTDSLDAKELTFCIETYANLLLRDGKWQDLKEWMAKAEHLDRSHSTNISYYTAMAKTLSKEKASTIVFPQKDCIIKTTYEWPLLVQLRLNGYQPVDCFIETEQSHTLISKKLAERCDAVIIADTLSIASSNGIIDVCPTLIKEFVIGDIKFTNLLVFTVIENEENLMPFEASLGTQEISRLGKITFYPEKLVVHQKEGRDKKPNGKSNLYFAKQNGLRIRSYYKGVSQPISFDLGYPHNILNKTCFANVQDTSNPLEIETARGSLSVNNPVYIDEKIARCSGILGIDFLHSFHKVTLDFDHMILDVESPTVYRPSRGKFGHSTDKFYLKRNKSALTACNLIEKDEQHFLSLLLNIGKNNPKKVVEISQELRQSQSPFYDAYTEAEGLFFDEKYKEAVNLLEKVLDNSFSFIQLSPSEQKVLANILKSYQLFKDCQPVKFVVKEHDVRLDKSQEGWIDIKINGKKKMAAVDLFAPYTEISKKYAKSMKVKVLGSANGITHGIIPFLEIGGIGVTNVHCIIDHDTERAKRTLPKKGKGIRIGWDLIHHFKQFGYGDGHLYFSLNKASTHMKKASVYRLKDWIIETESDEGYPTFVLDKKQNLAIFPQDIKVGNYLCPKTDFKTSQHLLRNGYSGKLSMYYLLKKAKTITFDLENMELF